MNDVFDINKVLLKLKNNRKPDNTIIYSGDEPKYIIANSKIDDITIVKMVSEKLYIAMRIMSKTKSKNKKIRESIGRPNKPNMNSEEFERFEYQFTHFESENLSDIKIPNFVHQYCNWNSRPATSIRTSDNTREIRKDWADYNPFEEDNSL